MNNPYSHLRSRERQPKRTASLIPQSRTPACKTRGSALNHQFLKARKENILNTGYNNRRSKLQQITNENKKIYVKINSQKTAYSRAKMNKSYESSCSISRRLSQSKISRRNSSRGSIRSSQVKRTKNHGRRQKNYQIQTRSISGVKENQLKQFKNLFGISQQVKASIARRRNSMGLVPKQKHLHLPPIKDSCKNISNGGEGNHDGEFLHKIAEEMFGLRKGRSNVTIL